MIPEEQEELEDIRRDMALRQLCDSGMGASPSAKTLRRLIELESKEADAHRSRPVEAKGDEK